MFLNMPWIVVVELTVDTGYFDFSKRIFHSIKHDHLVFKLSKIEILSSLTKRITNYLKDRTQIVNINGTQSTER